MSYNPTYLADISKNAKTVSTHADSNENLKPVEDRQYVSFADTILHGDLIHIDSEAFVMRIHRHKPDGGYKSVYQVYVIKEWLSTRSPIRQTARVYLLTEFDVKQPREKRKGKRTKLR